MNSNSRYSSTRPWARSSYSSSSSSSSNCLPPPPPSAPTAAPVPPPAGPLHGSLLTSTPWRRFKYFPQFVGEEGRSHSYTNSWVCHVWNSGNVNTTTTLTIFIFHFFVFGHSQEHSLSWILDRPHSVHQGGAAPQGEIPQGRHPLGFFPHWGFFHLLK